MVRLSFEQVDAIDALVVKRRAGTVNGLLAEAWPLVVERLKDRWPAFVEAALLQAHRHGAEDVQDMALYASLWCIWGAAFEDKPGFEWAREIVADPRRGAALKIHQLLHRTREELAKRQPAGPTAAPVVTAAQFDAALRSVEAQMARVGEGRAIFPREEARPVIKACDVQIIDLLVAEPETLNEYRHLPVGWQRTALARIEAPPVHWTRAPELPLQLATTSYPLRGGTPARLNLKVQSIAQCDAKVHPEVAHLSAQGRLAWKGRDTQRLSLALYALPPDPAAPTPGIAALTPADVQQLSITACGHRDAGAPFGTPQVEVSVVPATQWLTELRHATWPSFSWPGGTPAAPLTPAALRLEADGAARDTSGWQRGWAELPVKVRTGLDKLFNAWLRSVENPHLEVELSPLAGEAGITWGWRRTAPDTVAMRTLGRLDLIACAIDLRLTGELVFGGARARITVATKAGSELRTPIDELGGVAATEGQDLKSMQRAFRFPFTIDVEPVAGPPLATLCVLPLAEGLTGAVAGEAGLKLRPDGAGFQWFFALRSEPVSVTLQWSDPVVGTATVKRDLLPALVLADWAAG
jgi:hypothetical protein